jgi:ABC-2 type transport system permease protein
VTARRAIFLTTRREVRERIRSRAFLVSTVLMLVLVGGVFAISALTDDGPEDVRLAVVGAEARAVGEAVAAQGEGFDVEVETFVEPSAAAARSGLRDGDVDLALADGVLLTPADPSERAVAAVQGGARAVALRERLREAGLSPTEVRRVVDVSPLTVQEVSDAGEPGVGLAFFAAIMLYLAMFTAGLQVATGVVEEKGSRVVELILSSITAAQLLVGKVVGVGVTAFLQLALVFGLWIGVSLGTGKVELPESAAATAVLVVVFFLLGYVFYAFAFAAAAALVSRQEDVQTTTAPMMIALVGSYLVSIAVLNDPESGLARLCTVLPPSAPMVVPVRAAQDALGTGELVASLAAMVVGTGALVALGARIYERSVLRTGAPVRLGEALRLVRAR